LLQLAASCFVLTVPLFFAGIIFSSLIASSEINISTAFAYNLMGALFGGVMEYNSHPSTCSPWDFISSPSRSH